MPISTNVLTDTVKTLITVFGTRPNSDTNTIIIADYFPIVNPFVKKGAFMPLISAFRLSVRYLRAIDHKYTGNNQAKGTADNNATGKN